MSSGPPPWLGIEIKILQGHYKGYSGAVRDVNRMDTSISGLYLTIELSAWTYQCVNPHIVIDYEHVREPQFVMFSLQLCNLFTDSTPRHYRTLIEIAPLKQSQIFYRLRPNYTPRVYNKLYTPQTQVAQIAASATPPPSPTENQAGMELWWEEVMDDSEVYLFDRECTHTDYPILASNRYTANTLDLASSIQQYVSQCLNSWT